LWSVLWCQFDSPEHEYREDIHELGRNRDFGKNGNVEKGSSHILYVSLLESRRTHKDKGLFLSKYELQTYAYMGKTVPMQITVKTTLRAELIRRILAAILFSIFCIPSSYAIRKR
jgi:hypothetical protein